MCNGRGIASLHSRCRVTAEVIRWPDSPQASRTAGLAQSHITPLFETALDAPHPRALEKRSMAALSPTAPMRPIDPTMS